MAKFDDIGLDSRSLQVFLAVLEEVSVSRAADRLGLTQSAVSHALERLRARFDDPLFVRRGRGIAPTARAAALESPVRGLLDDMRDLTRPAVFEPARADLRYVIAANDFQRDLLLPEVFRRIDRVVRSVHLDLIPSGIPAPALLTHGEADLLITPHPPESADIFARRLLADRQVCFFDQAVRSAPSTWASYVGARHISLLFGPGETAQLERRLLDQGVSRDVVLRVSNFAAIAPFVLGTDLVATLPSLLAHGSLRGLATCAAPVDTGNFAMYLVWHRRHHDDAAHRWLRQQVIDVAADISSGW